MAKSKGISIPIKMDVKGARSELKMLSKEISKTIGKITSANKHLTRSAKESTKEINKQNTALKRENTTLNKNTNAWKRNTRALKENQRGQKKVTQASQGTQKALGGVLGSMKNLKGLAIRGGVWGAFAVGTIKATKSMISATKEMELLEVQFKTLLGSQGEAQKRMADLSKMASETPFELGEIARASRVLETLTKGALSTGEGLRLVGDASATTGSDFENLAMWVGRAYDGLQSNRPVGEAMMRMQELGLVSGEARNEIEKLQKAGKGKEAWKILESQLQRTSGGMKSLSQTAEGLESTTRDLVKEFWRQADASLGVSKTYKTLLGWGIKILNNVNETIEAERNLSELREREKQSEIYKAISRRALLQRQMYLDEANGIEENTKRREKINTLNRAIHKFAMKYGIDENELKERSNRASLNVWKALRDSNGQAKWAVDLAKQKVAVFEKQLKIAKDLNKEETTKKVAPKSPGGGGGGSSEADDIKKIVQAQKDWTSAVRQHTNAVAERQKRRQQTTPTQSADPMSDDTQSVQRDLNKKIQRFRDFKEIYKIEHKEMTGFVIDDATRRASNEIEILDQKFKKQRALYDKYNLSTLELDKRYAKQRQNIALKTTRFQVSMYTRAGDMIVQDMQHIFGETKALAVAQATIKGIQSAVNSFEFGTRLGGPVLGGIMAGLSTTATIAQISKMKSQNFATGGLPTGKNANVIMNERGQESILNASATARLGRENIDRLNRGQDIQNQGGNTTPSEMKVTYNPTINITGTGDSGQILSILDQEREQFGEMISDMWRRGFVNV